MKNQEKSSGANPGMSTGRRESAEEQCPICLSTPEDITLTLDCRHKFCRSCISEWTSQHNRCPLCRQVIHHLRYKVRNEFGVQIDHDEEVIPRSINEPHFHEFDNTTIVITPDDSPLFVLQPVRFASRRVRYTIHTLEQSTTFLLQNLTPGSLFVLPSNLIALVEMLESNGVTAFQSSAHHNIRFSRFQIVHASPFALHCTHIPRLYPEAMP